MKDVHRIAIAILAAASAAGTAAAAEVYRWTDANGTVHYSDEKPRDDTPFATLEFADTRSGDYDPATDPYSIRNQAARINASWTALTEARARRSAAPEQTSDHTRTATLDLPEQRIEYGTRYYNPWLYPSYVPARPQRIDPYAARRQAQAIEALDLAGPRPASINSGVHRDRVQRSETLPVSVTPPGRN